MIESIGALLTSFGVNWPKFLGQLVTFSLLLVGLRLILYRPMLKMLDERKSRIATGLQDAEAAAKARAESEAEAATRLNEAAQKAQALLDDTMAASERLKSELMAETQAEIHRLKQQQEAQLAAAQDEMLRQVRAEVAHLVVTTTEKVLEQHLSAKERQELAAKAAKELS